MTGYPKWFAVVSGPRAEQEAYANLRRQGYWCFYPHIRETVRRKQRGTERRLRVTIERPLFPRYLFVALRRPTEGLYGVKETVGVSCIVRKPLSGVPLEIPGVIMQRIMDWADGEGLVPSEKMPHWFEGKPGDEVEYTDGAFHRLITHITSIAKLDSDDEISIALELFGKEFEVPVPLSTVKLIAAAPR